MAKRTDANQTSIVDALRDFGATIWITSNCGHGAPDLVCGWSGKVYLFEVKDKNGRLTPDEIAWRDKWRGNYYVIYDVEQAIDIITMED